MKRIINAIANLGLILFTFFCFEVLFIPLFKPGYQPIEFTDGWPVFLCSSFLLGVVVIICNKTSEN